MFFSPLSIALTSLWKERVSIGAFRTFVRFALVWFCLFPLPLAVWEGLRFIIVEFPGLFSYLYFSKAWTEGREKEHITETCLYNFDLLKPHVYIVKLGFTRVYINFMIITDSETALTTHKLCFEQNMKNIRIFI